MSIYKIIEHIAQTASTNEKLAILKSHADNEVLKKCFEYAYNPRFNFWIRYTEIPKTTGKNDIGPCTFEVLDRLITRKVTGDAARAEFQTLIESLTFPAAAVACRILHHDLRCGASDTLASKVWPKLVPEYPVMLCDKFNAKTRKHLEKFENKCGFNVSLKEDGGRVLITVDHDGTVACRSRNGSELNVFGLFDADFSKYHGMVFDGELIIKSAGGIPDRKKSNGIYTKLVRNTATEAEVDQFTIVLWDVISLEQYLEGLGEVTYADRWESLKKVAPTWSKRVKLVEGKNVKTIAECLEFYEQMRERKQEGAIIKVLDSVWEDKRSKNCIKMKNESEGDFLCTGIEDGLGKYAGMIGALVCEDSTGRLKFSVGTGLNDEDRQKDPIEYIGKIIQVKFNEVITSKNKTTSSLFLPVFSTVRFDKKIANSLSELT